MGRVILHVDANSYYASVECLYNPDIREKPVVVGGDVEARHGIVLTKNQHAKRFGVQTGEALWQAKTKCPGLIIVHPDYGLYLRFSARMHRLFCEYSDRVESFGLDEAWIDLSGPAMDITRGTAIAEEIRQRIKDTLGITVSVGVADNKIIAKLGSDMRKPDAVTTVPHDRLPDMVWPLPVDALLYIGPATRRKLHNIGIYTIGALANVDVQLIAQLLGRNGTTLQYYANGLDRSPVMPVDYTAAIKSIGNSTTTPHDIDTMDAARCTYYLLAESVAARLRDHGFRARCISISARTTDLVTTGCQRTIPYATNLTDVIASTAMELFGQKYARHMPYRSIGISCSMLEPEDAPIQMDLLGDAAARLRREALERSIDDLRRRYGHQVLQRGVVLANPRFAAINPREDHTIHPVPFFAG